MKLRVGDSPQGVFCKRVRKRLQEKDLSVAKSETQEQKSAQGAENRNVKRLSVER